MSKGRIRAASRQQAFGVVKYIRLTLILVVVIIGLMVGGFWIFGSQILRFSFNQPVRLAVHYVDTVYELDGKEAESGKKYLLVAMRITGLAKVAYPITPDRFEMETSNGKKYRALAESPLFQDRGTSFSLERGEEVEGEIAFEVPQEAEGAHLFFPVR